MCWLPWNSKTFTLTIQLTKYIIVIVIVGKEQYIAKPLNNLVTQCRNDDLHVLRMCSVIFIVHESKLVNLRIFGWKKLFVT